MNSRPFSQRTRKNWLTDAVLLLSAVAALISGIYFLYFPAGYQGGRNASYNVQVLFTRQTWDDLHTWGGVAMIAAGLIHVILHWQWFVNMTRRTFQELTGKVGHMNARGRWNLILNATVAISFLLTAISSVYFLLVPGGREAVDTVFLFSRFTWDMLHTWAGVVFTAVILLHLAIHWNWITKVTGNMFRRTSSTRPVPQPVVTTDLY